MFQEVTSRIYIFNKEMIYMVGNVSDMFTQLQRSMAPVAATTSHLCAQLNNAASTASDTIHTSVANATTQITNEITDLQNQIQNAENTTPDITAMLGTAKKLAGDLAGLKRVVALIGRAEFQAKTTTGGSFFIGTPATPATPPIPTSEGTPSDFFIGTPSTPATPPVPTPGGSVPDMFGGWARPGATKPLNDAIGDAQNAIKQFIATLQSVPDMQAKRMAAPAAPTPKPLTPPAPGTITPKGKKGPGLK